MDRLAHIAQAHWHEYLPDTYATINDPDAFFQTLSDEAQSQIEDVEAALRGPDPADEAFQDRAGRFRVARQTAEEVVMGESWFLPEPESS